MIPRRYYANNNWKNLKKGGKKWLQYLLIHQNHQNHRANKMDLAQAVIALVYLGVLLLARHKSPRMLLFLGAAMLLSFFVPFINHEQSVYCAIVLDTFICIAMYLTWTVIESKKAHAVGFIGLFKIAFSTIFLATNMMIGWISYALVIDAAFLLQVFTAGGLLNDVGNRLDNLYARIAPKQHSLLRNGK